MSVVGIGFLAFLAAAVTLYYIAPRRWRWSVLLISSIYFYLSYSVKAAIFLAAAALVTYGFALWMGQLASACPKTPDAREEQVWKKRRERRLQALLAAALIVSFATLFCFKYLGFFIENVNGLLHMQLPLPSFLVPLGISFYIFQSAGYLIDVKRGKYPPEENFARYLLFLCYFPQIVQGPINRYGELGSQLYDGNEFNWDNIQRGVYRMMYGLMKKILIADTLYPVVEKIYTGYESYPGIVCFFGAALYSVQLYCDFSGGIDMLCGASNLFGIRMKENFRQPYYASSLADFWRRWHISLGEWMRDYLFYPLSMSGAFVRLSRRARKKLPPDIAKRVSPCIATFIVFLAVGIWQWPGWMNIAYGLWNGTLLSLAILWTPYGARLNRRTGYKNHRKALLALGMIRTNLIVIIGRYFSHASSLQNAFGMLKRTFSRAFFGGMSTELFVRLGVTGGGVAAVLTAWAVVALVGTAKERGVDAAGWLSERKGYAQFAVLFIGMALAVYFVYGNGDYIPIAYVYENI